MKDSNPDLDDSINVSEAHGHIVREAAATVREKRIADNGREPVSLGVVVACGVATLFAGGILSAGGGLFNYSSTFRENYVRAAPKDGEGSGPAPKSALEVFIAKGAKQYTAKCNGCHGADGRGDGANYPPLAGSKRVTGPSEALSLVILNGMQGPASDGKTYGAGVMPAQGAGMSPEDLAGLMTYVRNSFGNSTGDITTPEMAKAAIELSAKRENAGQACTSSEVESKNQKPLPGEPLDPKMMIDPITFAPAPAAP